VSSVESGLRSLLPGEQALTIARSGLARSDATRSGYQGAGLYGSLKAWRYALSNVARSGATRSSYILGRPVVVLGGVPTGGASPMRVLVASLAVQDLLNETPNTCTFTVTGQKPAIGAEIVMTFGTANNVARFFAGNILRMQQVYVGQKPANIQYQVEGIDYTWGLNQRLVTARYQSQSATTIARDLLARWAPAGYTGAITDGLPQLDEISFTNAPLMDAMKQLAGRIGGYAVCDYAKVVRLWVQDSDQLPPPRALTATHPSLQAIAFSTDLSQVVTRALVEGGGVNALVEVAPGETRIPVDDVGWYAATGGLVTSGPQRIRYTGTMAGGGSLVGGATGTTAPATGPTLSTSSGGPLVGTYKYAFTWVTASGESLPSPLSTVTTGALAAPTATPTITSVTGTALPAGRYRYAYTWVTASGETIASPTVDFVIGPLANPTTAPTITTVSGSPLPLGRYRYAYTWVTGTGETLPSPTRDFTAALLDTPTTAPAISRNPGAGLPPGNYAYGFTFLTASGETTLGPGAITTATATDASISIGSIATGPAGTTGRRVYRTAVNGAQFKLHTTIPNNDPVSPWTDTVADASLGVPAPVANTALADQRALVGFALGPAGTTARKVYRTVKDGTQLKLLTTVTNNTATALASGDGTADGSLGANAPTTNTASVNAQAKVGGIALGSSGVTSRKVYRTVVNGTTLQLLATIANNTATAMTSPDTTPDGSLGAAAPSSTTAVLGQVTVVGIVVGPGATTSRKVYRTTANTTQLKLLTTLANNTATTLPAVDTAADGTLGANVPVTDTSGLAGGAAGQVPAGSTTIPVSSVAPFSPEGWAQIDTQVIRYSGVSATTLTGVPATGVGSLQTTVPYNSPIVVVPQLVGIPASGTGAIALRILQGDAVNLLVIVDDPDAQAALAALLGGDGIVEEYQQDNRISSAEATARANALLALKRDPRTTVRYQVRDPTTSSGASITVDLPAPTNLAGTYRIQDVTISGFLGTATYPVFDVVASSVRFTFEDLLRRSRRRE
jgi:hypothetical protein